MLDVGCGQGIDVANYAIAGAQATGVDLTPRHVELARAHLAALGLVGGGSGGRRREPALPGRHFDRVSSNGVLHHTPGHAGRPARDPASARARRRGTGHRLQPLVVPLLAPAGASEGPADARPAARSARWRVSSQAASSTPRSAPVRLCACTPRRRLRRMLQDAGFERIESSVRHFWPDDTFATAALGPTRTARCATPACSTGSAGSAAGTSSVAASAARSRRRCPVLIGHQTDEAGRPAQRAAARGRDARAVAGARTPCLWPTRASVISSGTERAAVCAAAAAVAADARDPQPGSGAEDAPACTTSTACARRASWCADAVSDDIALGYSSAGVVLDTGGIARLPRRAQRVACAGAGQREPRGGRLGPRQPRGRRARRRPARVTPRSRRSARSRCRACAAREPAARRARRRGRPRPARPAHARSCCAPPAARCSASSRREAGAALAEQLGAERALAPDDAAEAVREWTGSVRRGRRGDHAPPAPATRSSTKQSS